MITAKPLKRQAKFVADDSFFFFPLLLIFQTKTSLDISCELSAKQMIHMKCRDVFSEKPTTNKQKNMTSAAVVIGALRVKGLNTEISQDSEQGITSMTGNTDGSFTMATSNSFLKP